MENQEKENTQNMDNNTPKPSEDTQFGIETVTPDTEKDSPDTNIPPHKLTEKEKDQHTDTGDTNQEKEEDSSVTPDNIIETVAP